MWIRKAYPSLWVSKISQPIAERTQMEKRHLARRFTFSIAVFGLLGLAACSDTTAPEGDGNQTEECVWINGELLCTG